MTCHAFWPFGALIALGGVLAQGPPPPLPPLPAPPNAGRSGAEILGRPGIRTRYVDPAGPAPPPGAAGLPATSPPERPLTIPLSESVQFAPSMEEGPFQQPTIRGLFRWDLERPAPR